MAVEKAAKKAFPLRISVQVLDAFQQWADDELRSLNAQIEYALRDALKRSGRWPRQPLGTVEEGPDATAPESRPTEPGA